MKRTLLAVLLAQTLTSFSQTVCNTSQQISTNPAAAVNTQKPTLVNHFDWTTSSFNLRAEQLTSTTITSPFYQGPWNTDVSDLVDSKDRLPVDGWELINADFGYNNNGTPATSKVFDPKLLLYNRYTATFRLFFAKGHTTTNDYNYIKINLMFSPSSGQYSFNTFELNNNNGILMPLDISDYKTKAASFQFMKDFAQTPANWVYTDFPMHYDPCTCMFRSRITVQIKYITAANVDLLGAFTGKLAAITNNSGSVTNPPEFTANFNTLGGTLNEISKAYKTIDDFIADVKKVNGQTGALDNMNTALKSSSFLKAGLSAVPWLNLAISFLNFFTGGGKSSGPQAVALTPTSIDMNGKISGTISNEVLNTAGIFVTPGSDPTGADDTKYPFYSQPMGIITLTKTPKLKWYTALLNDNSSDCCFTDVLRNDVVLDRTTTPIFEYALNPAAGLHIQDVEAAIVFGYSDNGYSNATWTKGYHDGNLSGTYHQTLTYDGFDASSGISNFRTNYFPIECLAGNVFNFESWNDSDPQNSDHINHVYIKFKFNLARNSGTGQNVLVVQTYDITAGIQRFDWDVIRHITFPPSTTSFNYSVKPEPVLNTCGYTGTSSNWQPITSTRLTSICNSTTYKNSHYTSLSSNTEPHTGHTWNMVDSVLKISDIKRVSLYPNPTASVLNIAYPGSLDTKEFVIVNAIGQTFGNLPSKISHGGNNTQVSCDVSNLQTGLYFVIISREGHKAEAYKFIKQ